MRKENARKTRVLLRSNIAIIFLKTKLPRYYLKEEPAFKPIFSALKRCRKPVKKFIGVLLYRTVLVSYTLHSVLGGRDFKSLS